MRAFFRRHSKIHAAIHWLLFALGGIVLDQDKILGAAALFPAGSVIPRYIAYGLGVVAFSNLLVGKTVGVMLTRDKSSAPDNTAIEIKP
jgi:hypothetical protein